MEEIEVLRQHVESLGLDKKTTSLTAEDLTALCSALRESDETSLAEYVERLGTPAALEDLIVNTLYG